MHRVAFGLHLSASVFLHVRSLLLGLEGSTGGRYAFGKDFGLWLQRGQFSLALVQGTQTGAQKGTFMYEHTSKHLCKSCSQSTLATD